VSHGAAAREQVHNLDVKSDAVKRDGRWWIALECDEPAVVSQRAEGSAYAA
jgi:hypothetical protein